MTDPTPSVRKRDRHMPEQPPLLRDVIDVKESISTSDYVLSLAEATTPEGAAQALHDYVVTGRLLANFDEALGLIKSALDGHNSKAAYLHGSFGAGKSHFMAVLYALLSGTPEARARTEFDGLLNRHEWLTTGGKKFLLVPYHMLGAKAMEQRVLGGYVSHVKRLYPQVPTPQVYRTDALFADIRANRASFGDEAVIRGLGTTGAGAEDDEWGEGFAWTPELLDAALAAPESEQYDLDLVHPSTPAELRAKLVDDASTNLLPGFVRNAAEDEHGFISLDAGLSVIAAHAKSLGYDGLILFMDELILWLATLIHDQRLVARESGKITNLVEGGDARRAIPIVSFIARQRDLRELVGEEVSGAAESAIQDTLNLAYGRFDKITLEDRNLPEIAHARLLRPKDEDADQLIGAAFEQTKRIGPRVWDDLLGSDSGATGADADAFRLTYPFSPAFMDTLVHISSALQRSRTGLKLMGQLLADHRDELRLGDLVPVGDLYQVIADGGDKPFTDSLKVVFEAADRLYRTKLRPFLLTSYDLSDEDIERFQRRPETVTDTALADRCRMFAGDNRLACTLLLSAVAPSAQSLSELTIRRLGALNYGSVKAPIPGSEVGIIKNKVAEWAARFPEIKETGTTANPGVRLELSGVDVDSVIANAQVNDNTGNRRALAKRLLAEEFGVEQGRLVEELPFIWRGTDRTAEIVFANVADEDELPDHALVPQEEGRWRIVIDLPFDEGEWGPVEDVNRMRRLRELQRAEPTRTVAWVPAHLSAQRFADFRRLVVIDKALADERRFDTQYAGHLNADNRARARGLLQTQRETLLKQIRGALKQAYGLAQKQPADTTVDFDEHLVALPDIHELKLSIGQPLRDAIRHVAARLLAYQFPAHPDLDPDATGAVVRPGDARKVFTHVRAAAESRDGRIEVPAIERKLMQRIAGPLMLGEQKEAYFELSRFWADHFRRMASAEGITGDLSLISLSDWIDRPDARGLPTFLSRLVVAAFAEMDDRVWVRGGTVLEPAPGLSEIKDHDALRDQPLPAESDWDAARDRYERIFGQKPPALRRGCMVNQFARQIITAAREHREHVAELVRQLEAHREFLGLDDTDETGRLGLARRCGELLTALTTTAERGGPEAKRTVEALASFDLRRVSADRYGASVKQARAVAETLSAAPWRTLELALGQGDEGAALLDTLRGKAHCDQHTADLRAALGQAEQAILAVAKRNQPQPPPVSPPPMPPPPGPEPVAAGHRSGRRRTTVGEAIVALKEELAELVDAEPNVTIEVTWRVVDS